MDLNGIPAQQWIMYAAAMGFVVGLVPLIVGLVKRRFKYGLFGLIGSIGGGTLLGLILAIPIAAVFTWLIIRDPRSSGSAAADDLHERSGLS